jgi:hypothetical protein
VSAADRERRRRRRRRAGIGQLLLALSVLAAVFAIGVAVGEALHDNPRPGLTTTQITTLSP